MIKGGVAKILKLDSSFFSFVLELSAHHWIDAGKFFCECDGCWGMISRVKAEFIGGDGKMYHSHDGLAPHTHEPLESPGFFSRRAQPLTTRDYTERAFTVGIGGPVGTGYVCTDQAFISSLVNATNLAVGT